MITDMEKPKVGVGFGVMVVRDGKVLLGRRHEDPEKADSELHGEGTWTMPGGKLEFGESFEDGARREVLEETGVDIPASSLQVICVANDVAGDAHFVTVGLLCGEYPGEPRVMEPDEITEWGWFPLDSLPSPLFFPSREILDNRAAETFYSRKDE